MKTYYFLLILIPFVITYLCNAFVEANIDFTEWPYETRQNAVLVLFVTYFLAFIIILSVNKDKEQ